MKLVTAWVDDMARAFDKAIMGNFPMEVTPFLECLARELAEIKARAERRRQKFWELERALKGDGTRRKRGLFDGGGQLLNWLFGTATTKDLESVYSRLESFDKKGLKVVHLLQLNMTMRHLAEHESEISALMTVVSQMRREQAQPRKVFNDSWTHLARELLFLQKVTRSGEKANRALHSMADVLHGWQTGLADAAIGRLSPLLCPPNVLAKALNSVRQALPQGWGLTLALQGGNCWRAYQEARCVSYAGSHQQRVVGIPFVRRIGSIPGCIARLAAVRRVQRGRSPEMLPYIGSLCPFLKPIDQKGRMKSCTAVDFLQEQEGIQWNCHLDSKKWTGIDLFYIGGKKWGYAGKDNVTIVLQCPGKRIGGIGRLQVLQASFRQMMPLNVTSVIDEEAAGMLSGLLAPVVEQLQPVTKSPIVEKAPAALRTPTCKDLAGTSSHLKAVERLQRKWEGEENAKRYPFEWLIGSLFPLPLLVYL
ncbi:Uncharacterized protein APZ42_015679 [Daphnia magna]|uniref:Uncharacterized protein n=1 Tax=Daphnia magna TaxID=35525 RepID=A0A162NTR2_9CRUS|nr:Uncharacterized protein APZ42_015679 [Daphnia magna]